MKIRWPKGWPENEGWPDYIAFAWDVKHWPKPAEDITEALERLAKELGVHSLDALRSPQSIPSR